MIELNIDNYRKIKILDKFLQGHSGIKSKNIWFAYRHYKPI